MQFQLQKAYLLKHFQEYRIVQSRVVFIHGLPSSLSHREVLQRQLVHLGVTHRINIQYLSKDFYSAFIQFENELSAALLILMLNDLPMLNRALRVFYGSTKFCPHFLKNHQCQLSSCNYAHYYLPHLTHLRDQAKQIDHNGIALFHLYQQLPHAIVLIQAVLSRQQTQQGIFSHGKPQLQAVLAQLSFYTQNQQPEPELPFTESETNGEVEWTSLEKQIQSQTVSNEGEKKEDEEALEGERGGGGSSPKDTRVQGFLDAAERFLTKLIFQSSMFVY